VATEIVRKRFTVDEYHAMAEAGILAEDDHVELVSGEIVQMSPIGPRHAACVDRLDDLLRESAPRGTAIIRVRSPIAVGEHHEPEPDISVLRFRPDYYAGGLPVPADVLLVIEVADTSPEHDRDVKLAVYARAGIPESWLADLRGGALERHTEPSADGYRLVTRAGRGQVLGSTVLPSLALDVARVIGPAGEPPR
jgi:Uma2 family endonuclease